MSATDAPCEMCGKPVTTFADTPLCSITCKENWMVQAIRTEESNTCPVCNEECATAGAYTQHCKNHHDIDPRVEHCETCGEEFVPSNDGGRFCSRECFAEVHHRGITEIECTSCGEMFDVSISQYEATLRKRGVPPRYCSHLCCNSGEDSPRWQENTSRALRKTPEYYQWKKAVHASRDDCAECGATENLQAHHEVPVAEDRERATDPDNGVLLCGKHHSEKHPDLPDGMFF